MILDAVFNYLKNQGPSDVHAIASSLQIPEGRCLLALLELQSRSVIKQDVIELDKNSNSCYYSVGTQEFDNDSEFCICKTRESIFSDFEAVDFGYWDTCGLCGKHIEDGFHYYHHFDGEDHDEIDMWE